MKTLNIFVAFVIGAVLFSACDKEAGPVMSSNPGSPSISSPEDGQSFMLSRDQAGDTLMTISWSEADFGFTAAPNYKVQLGIAGDNFATPMQVASVQKTSASVTTGDLNKMLLSAGLAGGEAHDLQLRVIASVSDSTTHPVSDPVSISVTPYQTTFPPIYMIGAAVGGWSIDQAVIVPSTQPNVYQNIAKFQNGETFRFFGQKDWGPDSYNYPYFAAGTINNLLENANDGDQNFKFLGDTGYYRVTVDLKNLTVQMQAVEKPVMYMTGAAIGGWDMPGSGASIEMTFVQEGVFTASTDFINGEAFRFFAQADWSPTSYNYPYFSNGTVSDMLENANDGDENFRFGGDSGTYKITLNLNDNTVEMEAQ